MLKQLAVIFGLAFIKAATMSTAINGFQKTGIYPFNPDVFNDNDFMAAETTDIFLENNNHIASNVPHLPIIEINTLQASNSTENNTCESEPTPGCSHWKYQSFEVEKTAFKNVSPKEILPVPQQTFCKRGKKKRNYQMKGKTAVISESPYKKALKEHKKKVIKCLLNQKLKVQKKIIFHTS